MASNNKQRTRHSAPKYGSSTGILITGASNACELFKTLRLSISTYAHIYIYTYRHIDVHIQIYDTHTRMQSDCMWPGIQDSFVWKELMYTI